MTTVKDYRYRKLEQERDFLAKLRERKQERRLQLQLEAEREEYTALAHKLLRDKHKAEVFETAQKLMDDPKLRKSIEEAFRVGLAGEINLD